MKIGCCYRAFPGGPAIRSLFDYGTQTVDGVPDDIIKLRNDPAVYQYMSSGEMVMPTQFTWMNIAETFGMFPEASLVIGDSMYHTLAITKTATFAYGFGSPERDKKIFAISDLAKQPTLFPQPFKSIGFVKTFPEYYDWYQSMALLNVFKYHGGWMIMTKDGIKPFTYTFDEQVNFGTMNVMQLARTDDSIYAVYQDGGINKYLTI